jgi:hypothetical protein
MPVSGFLPNTLSSFEHLMAFPCLSITIVAQLNTELKVLSLATTRAYYYHNFLFRWQTILEYGKIGPAAFIFLRQKK